MAVVTVLRTASSSWRVPAHVPGTLKVLLVGGGGGDWQPGEGSKTNRGGESGYIRGTLDLPRGTRVDISMGGKGQDGPVVYAGIPLGGGGTMPGGNGGIYGSHRTGTFGTAGAAGGSASSLLIGGGALIAVAGGGGGGGRKSTLVDGVRAGRGAAQTGPGGDGSPSAATEGGSTGVGQGGRGGTVDDYGNGGNSSPGKQLAGLVEKGQNGGVVFAFGGGKGASRIVDPTSPLFNSNVGGGGGGGGGYLAGGGGGGAWGDVQAGGGGGGASWSDPVYITEGNVTDAPAPTDNVLGYCIFEFEPAPGGRRGLGIIRA